MAIPGNFDSTYDNALWISGNHTVGAATTGNSGANGANVANSPTDLTVAFEVYSTSTTTGDCAIVTVQGSTTADFSAGNHILAVTAFGAPAIIASTLGCNTTAARGAGSYALRCSNVGFDNTANPVVCQYIRTQVRTVGTTSAISYGARVIQSV